MKTNENTSNLTVVLLVILGIGFIVSLILSAIMELISPGKITAFPFIATGLAGTLTGMLIRLESSVRSSNT